MFCLCFVNLRDLWEVLAVMIRDSLFLLCGASVASHLCFLQPKISIVASGKAFVVDHGA